MKKALVMLATAVSMGGASYFALLPVFAHRGLGQTLGSAGRNVELPNFTQALYEARDLAMTRMQDEANQLAASGIVGVRLEEKSHQWGSHTIEFLSLGTAVMWNWFEQKLVRA